MTDIKKSMIRTLNDNNILTRKIIEILSYRRGVVLVAIPYKRDVPPCYKYIEPFAAR